MENISPSKLPSWYSNHAALAALSAMGENGGALKPPPAEAAKPPKRSQAAPLEPFRDPDYRQTDKRRRDWIDVDKLNRSDPQACSDYAWPIFKHMREAELSRLPDSKYLDEFQPDVNPKMRAILVDWLVEVAEEYKLCADSLYQTINYLDRFLSIHVVQRNKLQLVGVTCLFVAAKYEEIYPPSVADLCFITDNTYTREEIIGMEELVLKKLGYELTVPTSKLFLRRLLQVCQPDEHLHFLSNYLTEISLLDHNMMGFLPSEIAAAAIYVSNLILQREPWSGTLQHYSMYEVKELTACIRALSVLHQVMSSNRTLVAIQNKYGHSRFHSVSRFPCLTALPNI